MQKTSTLTLAAALAGAVVVSGLAVTAKAGPAEKPMYKFEKCFGVVKAGMNDCQTTSNSCAGTVKRDAQPDSWVYVPTGTCEKLVGGSTMPKSS
jgi:uncharacterized membrane protein